MAKPPPSGFSRSLPWLLFGAVLMPVVATGTVGIVVLALWRMAGDIALGVLTLVFAVFALAGGLTTLFVLRRQQRLARLQAEFVAHVSHELRTPLASIRMFQDTLRLGRVAGPDERARVLDLMDRETIRLERLVEQLLDFRRQSRGSPSQAAEQTDAAALVGDVVDVFRQREAAGDRLSLVVEPALPRVLVDPEGFRQAVSNLLDNAFGHGGDGPVVVTVRAEGPELAVHVRDSGPGLSRREAARVFRRFYRGAASARSGRPGMGLGLAIVDGFARAHGGRAAVESAPGRGATFTIRLPAVPPPAEDLQEGAA